MRNSHQRLPGGRRALLAWTMLCLLPAMAAGQDPSLRFGEVVPRDVREIYDRGLQYLANSQQEAGDWPSQGYAGPGVTAMAAMVMLASGEDPNFGLYSNHVRRALRNVITAQNADTGIIGSSMYEHGFATLTLAEAYGAVDDRNLWAGGAGTSRSIGRA